MPWQVWLRLARLPRVARVATFHDTPPNGWSGQLMRAIFGVASARLSRHLQAAIPVSIAPAAHLRLHAACHQTILPGCIDLAPYREMAGLRDAALRVLFVGRLEPRKGVLVLLQAWKTVQTCVPQARLVICGDGPQRDEARELVSQLSLVGSVDFVGAVDDAGKRDWMRRSSLFCAPSLFGESYGLVLAEAMAAGLPVIAAANAGYREVLTGALAQGLVAPGDVDALARKLVEWLSDAGLRERMSELGAQAYGRADVGQQLHQFEAIYADALRSKLEGTGQ
jgi:phosphatidylinositol alpha-mannosyltransferase